MNSKAEQSIDNHIAEALQVCSVQDSWLVFESYSKKVLSLSKEVMKHRKEWLTVSDCYLIFSDHVHSCLKRLFPEEKVSGALAELIGKANTSHLKRQILDFIRSIPRKYEVYFPFPLLKVPELNSIQLCESLCIRRYVQGDSLPGGSTSGSNALSSRLLHPQELQFDTTYIVIQTPGYITPVYMGGSVDDIAFRRSLSALKQLLHLSLISDLLVVQQEALLFNLLAAKGLYVYISEPVIVDLADQNKVVCNVNLPLGLANYIKKITLNTESEKFKAAEQKGGKGIRDFMRSNLDAPSKLILSDSSSARSVKSALEWAFDSQLEENETISFIQLSIGLEAILGENARIKESLTETLADRCAYLLGNNVENRKVIRDHFRKFYELRSALVHGRSMRLKDKDKAFLVWGRHILDQVILKEFSNLKLV